MRGSIGKILGTGGQFLAGRNSPSPVIAPFTAKTISTEVHPLFSNSEVANNVFFIQEKYFHSWNLANIFFVRGSERDLLIDTGVGIFDLAAYLTASGLRAVPDKPLDVVLTHLHFDHSGGAHQFSKVYMHEEESKYIREGDRYMTASWVTGREVVPKPAGFDPSSYRPRPATVHDISHSHSFPLGDREFQVLHLPGHSPGSISLLDGEGVLVTGDTLYQTTHGLIDWYPGSHCARMKNSVETLVSILREGRAEIVLPGHNQVLTKEAAIEAGEDYIAASNRGRSIRKSFSRLRARTVLKANSKTNIPELARELIAN